MTEPTRHGIATDERKLHALLRDLAERRGMSRTTINELAGLGSGYAEKVLAQVPQRRIGIETLFPIVWALGARVVIEDDPENLAKIAEHLNGRVDYRVGAPVVGMRVKTASVLRKQAAVEARKMRREQTRRARELRDLRMTPEQRSASAKHAAITRHKRERALRKQRRNAPANPKDKGEARCIGR